MSEPKEKSEESEVKYQLSAFNFPMDCVGEIIRCFESSRELLNFELTSRSFNHFINKESPQCCQNITFRLTKKIPNFEVRKCHRLIVSRTIFKENKEREFSCEDLKKFPNLNYLFFNAEYHGNIGNCLFSSECFSVLGEMLERLEVENLPILDDEHFKYIPNIKSLSIKHKSKKMVIPENLLSQELFKFYDRESYKKRKSPNCSFLKHLPKLEVLKLSEIESVLSSNFELHPPTNLRKIVLWNTKNISLNILQHFNPEKLEHIELVSCDDLFIRDLTRNYDSETREKRRKLIKKLFSRFSNLKNVQIRDCEGFDQEDKDFISNECFKDLEDFQLGYRGKEFLMGTTLMFNDYFT